MCQISVISQSINQIGRKSFDRRTRVVSPLFVERKGELARLCRSLDELCEMLHQEFPTITKEDYRLFGPELKLLIDTLNGLLKDSKKYANQGRECLKEYIDDLEELEHDIICFRVHLQNNAEMKQTLDAIGKLDFSRFER